MDKVHNEIRREFPEIVLDGGKVGDDKGSWHLAGKKEKRHRDCMFKTNFAYFIIFRRTGSCLML